VFSDCAAAKETDVSASQIDRLHKRGIIA